MIKHGAASAANVTISYRPDSVTVEVADQGAGAPPPEVPAPRAGSGHGIIGMRERVAVFGGEFTRRATTGRRLPGAGPLPDRGGDQMIRVVVADDQALVRGGFRVLVDSAPDLEVVGEAGDGTEAVALARKERPDVILMDIRMPHLDGLEATRVICGAEETEDVRVLILTTFDLDEYVYAALRAGASGFLLKDTPPNDLLAGIRVVAAGDALLAPSVTRQLISEFVRRPDSDRPPPATLDVLTGREREVLTLVARGWSNAEIAERLYLSPATAKTHVGRLLTKLQARDRTQLVVIAYETGLVTPSGP